MCVCERERERETDRQTERQTETEKDRDAETQRQKQTTVRTDTIDVNRVKQEKGERAGTGIASLTLLWGQLLHVSRDPHIRQTHKQPVTCTTHKMAGDSR